MTQQSRIHEAYLQPSAWDSGNKRIAEYAVQRLSRIEVKLQGPIAGNDRKAIRALCFIGNTVTGFDAVRPAKDGGQRFE
ncbi:MAG: hypothetical protein LBE30_00810 [Comamonas sp.]|nr:hypothetical protein [Comamonas sp.]